MLFRFNMAVYFPNSLHSNKSPFRHQNRQSSHRFRNGATRLNNPTTFCASFLLPLAKFQFINMCFKLIYPSNSKYKLSPTSSVDNLYYRSRTTTQTPCTPISPYLGHLSNIYMYVTYIYTLCTIETINDQETQIIPKPFINKIGQL